MRIFGKVLVVLGLLIVGTGIGVGIDRGNNYVKPKKSVSQPDKK